MTRFKRILAIAVLATATMAAPLVAGGTATAAPRAASETAAVLVAAPPAATGGASTQACGFYQPESYNHCGNTWVQIHAENFWGTDYYLCVGPGVTHLGYLSTWRIINAVYTGFLC
jgi:uncharacterized protein DUF6355